MNRLLRTLLSAGFLLSARILSAQPAADATSEAAAANDAALVPPKSADAATPRATFEHAGQTFVLARSAKTANVDTDEYVLDGETLATWTELVTVQRLTLARAATAEEFLSHFQRRIEPAASIDVLERGATAAVFSVRFPKSEQHDEQVMICLAFGDGAAPTVLHIVQFALKPALTPRPEGETRLLAWRDRFLAQARTRGAR